MLSGSKIKLQSDRQGVLAFWLRKDGREKGEEGGRGGGREGRKVNHLYMLIKKSKKSGNTQKGSRQSFLRKTGWEKGFN